MFVRELTAQNVAAAFAIVITLTVANKMLMELTAIPIHPATTNNASLTMIFLLVGRIIHKGACVRGMKN